MGGCDWVWVVVTGCGWVGKMVKPVDKVNLIKILINISGTIRHCLNGPVSTFRSKY